MIISNQCTQDEIHARAKVNDIPRKIAGLKWLWAEGLAGRTDVRGQKVLEWRPRTGRRSIGTNKIERRPGLGHRNAIDADGAEPVCLISVDFALFCLLSLMSRRKFRHHDANRVIVLATTAHQIRTDDNLIFLGSVINMLSIST